MKIILLLILILAVAFFVTHTQRLQPAFQTILNQLRSLDKFLPFKIPKSQTDVFSAPGPLVYKKDAVQVHPSGQAFSGQTRTLTVNGVILWTNTQRADNGNLPALTHNKQLDEIALERAQDMFAKQYFAHISPSGTGAADIAHTTGYDYLALGENIALGNFESDKALVQAWMDSPGHRANILNSHYSEIGVAVQKGTFEGHGSTGLTTSKTWIGVQIFARPTTACPGPDEALKKSIDDLKNRIAQMGVQARALKEEIDAMPHDTKQERDAYNKKVNEYNALIGQVKALVDQEQPLVDRYNGQANTYNVCLGK